MRTERQNWRPMLIALWTTLILLMPVIHALGQEQALIPEGRKSAPIVLEGQTVATVYSGYGVGTVEERAGAIMDRLTKVARNSKIGVESIRVTEAGGLVGVLAGQFPIMAVTEDDAAAVGRSRIELATEYAENMRRVIRQYREHRRWSQYLLGALKAIGAALIFAAILLGFAKLSRRVRDAIRRRIRRELEALSARSTKRIVFVRVGRVALMLWGAFRWVFALVWVWILGVLVLGFFPDTAEFANSISGWILSPVYSLSKKFFNYIPDLFFLSILGLITHYLIRLSRFIFGEIRDGKLTFAGFYPEWADPTHKLVRTLLLILALVVAFPYLPGATSPAFQGISIFVGVLLSLGSTSAVANIIAGIILTYMREFKVGDRIRIGEAEGDVMEMTLLVTRIRTIKNVEVSIPNATILNAHVINYSVAAREKKLILHTSVTIGYDAPWRQVHALLKQAAARTPAVLAEPAPFILQTALNDFYVTYELNVYTDQPYEMPFTYSHLHKHIQDAFNEYGVQIMSPNYLSDRAKPTLVPKDQWYMPPARPPGDPEADQ